MASVFSRGNIGREKFGQTHRIKRTLGGRMHDVHVRSSSSFSHLTLQRSPGSETTQACLPSSVLDSATSCSGRWKTGAITGDWQLLK